MQRFGDSGSPREASSHACGRVIILFRPCSATRVKCVDSRRVGSHTKEHLSRLHLSPRKRATAHYQHEPDTRMAEPMEGAVPVQEPAAAVDAAAPEPAAAEVVAVEAQPAPAAVQEPAVAVDAAPPAVDAAAPAVAAVPAEPAVDPRKNQILKQVRPGRQERVIQPEHNGRGNSRFRAGRSWAQGSCFFRHAIFSECMQMASLLMEPSCMCRWSSTSATAICPSMPS